MNNLLNIFIFLSMTLMGAFAGYFLKKASSAKSLKEMLIRPFFYLGGLLYLISAILNVYLLKFIDFSIMLPLTSVTYIWTMIIAYKLLNERITKNKIYGIGLIITGVFVLVLGG